MITLRIAEILAEKGITKSRFAEMMGVQKQNVNLLLETQNIKRLEQIGEVLNVQFTDLFQTDHHAKPRLNGFVEYRGEIYRIKSKEDLQTLIDKLQ